MSILSLFHPTPEQYKAATLPCDLSVGAGAGSGKTATLAARYLHLTEQQMGQGRSMRLTAITFTDRAAREMRNRIRKHVQDWAGDPDCPTADRVKWQDIAAELDAARIGTIHSLCSSILRAHPAEAGIDPRFEVLEEGRAAALRVQAMDDTMAWVVNQPNEAKLFDFFSTQTLLTVLEVLLENRLDAGPVLRDPNLLSKSDEILASALRSFIGKTPVTARIYELRGLSNSGMLEQDAGPKLAEQVKCLLGEWAGAGRLLDQAKPFEAAAALFRIRREYLKANTGKKTGQTKPAVMALQSEYDRDLDPWLGGKKKEEPPDPELDARMRAAIALLPSVFEHLELTYKEAREQRHALDFDDLEEGARRLLENPQIAERWQQQMDAVLVDEFQDTNERQRQIILALAGDARGPGTARRLFIVGDAKQSIYRFRGANVEVFRQVEQDIANRGGQHLSLDQTFRGHKALVGLLNDILQVTMKDERGDKAPPYSIRFEKLRSGRDLTKVKSKAPFVELLYGLGEGAGQARPAAAALLARRLHELHHAGELEWGDVACLFRASTGFPAYEEAFEDAGIPFVTVAGRGFYERPEIRDLLTILHALADPTDDLAVAGFLRSPAFGLSDPALYKLRRGPDGDKLLPLHDALFGDVADLAPDDRARAERARAIFGRLAALTDRVPVAELITALLQETDYPAVIAGETGGTRLARNLDKLVSDAQASGLVRLTEFLEYVETLRSVGAREGEAPAEAEGSVRLMSIHKAKGLQFPVVVLADASRGRLTSRSEVLFSSELGVAALPADEKRAPLSYAFAHAADLDREKAEDRRLLYVAATRAQDKLIICGHKTTTRQTWMEQLIEALEELTEEYKRMAQEEVQILTDQLKETEKRGAKAEERLLIERLAMANQRLNAAKIITALTLEQSQGKWQEAPLPCGECVNAIAAPMPSAVDKVAPRIAEKKNAVSLAPLYAPIDLSRAGETDGKRREDEEAADLARRLTTRRGKADGMLAGQLFHAAVRRWRFAPEAAVDALLRAEAFRFGLIDPESLEATLAHVTLLLGRFSADPLWAEINAAARQQEIPFTFILDGTVTTGSIDLLYRGPAGRWRIVDFKTDALAGESEMRDRMNRHHISQMRRYQNAARALLHESPEGLILFLDLAGKLRIEFVEG